MTGQQMSDQLAMAIAIAVALVVTPSLIVGVIVLRGVS